MTRKVTDGKPGGRPPRSAKEVSRRGPRIFIASSTEAQFVMRRLANLIEEAGAEAKRWSDAFPIGSFTLEAILEASRSVDGAVVIAGTDDMTTSRGRRRGAPRDNVLLELGVFMAALSPRRTALVSVADDAGRLPKLPSDLAGLTTVTYRKAAPGEAEAALLAWLDGFFVARESLTEPQLATRNGRDYTWDDVVRGVEHLEHALEHTGFAPDAVLGLGRSGGVVGGLLAAFLGSIPLRLLDLRYEESSRGYEVAVQACESLDWPAETRRVVVVEGATTGGLTPRRVEAALARQFPEIEFRFAFLIQSSTSSFRGDYYAYLENGTLQRLPWHGPRSRTFLAPARRGEG
jgi:hypoxanthine phosphoribosyltransferase